MVLTKPVGHFFVAISVSSVLCIEYNLTQKWENETKLIFFIDRDGHCYISNKQADAQTYGRLFLNYRFTLLLKDTITYKLVV